MSLTTTATTERKGDESKIPEICIFLYIYKVESKFWKKMKKEREKSYKEKEGNSTQQQQHHHHHYNIKRFEA